MTSRPKEVVYRIKDSGITIYDRLNAEDERYLEIDELEVLIRASLKGRQFDYPLRTRSKIVKEAICQALGYPTPGSFRKTQPRFPGQNFDTYIQKSNNLQIWNEEIAPTRRYVLVRLDHASVVSDVKVVTGEALARLDPTGTLTQKYQAKSQQPVTASALNSGSDTTHLTQTLMLASPADRISGSASPTDLPASGAVLPIAALYERLLNLIGTELSDPGLDQERNRGMALHKAVCTTLGFTHYQDQGQFPDVMNQLLEIKLQTSPTIDLGLITPDSTQPIAHAPQLRHCDARYAVFYACNTQTGVRLEHLVLSTGLDFFRFFQRFEGRVLNKKLQIPLPVGFFSEAE